MRPYRRTSAERPDMRAGAETDRKSARLGTAAAVPAVLREAPGRGLDQMEGDELSLNRVGQLRLAARIAQRHAEFGVSASRKRSRARSRFRAPGEPAS